MENVHQSEQTPLQQVYTRCCVVGAGPAGVLVSLLLARAGIPVTLIEAHKDFDRDFRGDTVHASTLEVLDQIGLAERVLELPHEKSEEFRFRAGGRERVAVVYKRLPTKFPYMAMMPQSRFLEFLVDEAMRYRTFSLIMGATAQRLIEDNGTVGGVVYHDGRGESHVTASLVIAADGRFSRLRTMAGLTPVPNSEPLEVLWFRVPRLATDAVNGVGFDFGPRAAVVVLRREREWQVGYVMAKGGMHRLKEEGLETFHASVSATVPWLAERARNLNWSDLHLLSVQGSRLTTWHKPGLLLIGDAAHVMLPVGGVGINCAIADAVEAANVLIEPLRDGSVTESHLAEVQKRREGLTKFIQFFQARNTEGMVRAMASGKPLSLPLLMQIVLRIPWLRDVPGRVAAFGIKRARLQASVVGETPSTS